jgi:acetylornithine deacetylase/succinyl-diaminopimelate desuccinylase-like protein
MKQSNAVPLLRQLVALPSVEPTQTDRPDEIGGESRMADFFARYMSGLGFSVETQEVIPGRSNLLARRGPAAPRRTWLLEAHMDTVGIDGMLHDPFAAEIRGGRLYGRGAADCKGPMAAAMDALARIDLAALEARGDAILFLAAMAEETGNNGARAALPILPPHIDRTIVLEPTETRVVHASKGIAALEIDFTGRSAHGSNPEVGLNAIRAAMEFARRLDAYAAAEAAANRHPLVGAPSMNLGVIRGGIAPNVVPPSCHLELDWRVVPGEDIEDVKTALRRILDDLVHEGLCLAATLRQTQQNAALLTSGDSALVRELLAACRAAGLDSSPGGVRWCCDASVFSPRSAETVVFGPGSIKQGHATVEYIDTAELDAASTALALLLSTPSS